MAESLEILSAASKELMLVAWMVVEKVSCSVVMRADVLVGNLVESLAAVMVVMTVLMLVDATVYY